MHPKGLSTGLPCGQMACPRCPQPLGLSRASRSCLSQCEQVASRCVECVGNGKDSVNGGRMDAALDKRDEVHVEPSAFSQVGLL